MDKALYTIEQAMAYTGLGKTSIYEALADGRLRGRKFGTRTLIEAKSLHAFVASMPTAKFTPKRRAHNESELNALK